MKYAPAIILLVIAVVLFFASRAGDNPDARALAGIMIFPAIGALVLATIAALIARVL